MVLGTAWPALAGLTVLLALAPSLAVAAFLAPALARTTPAWADIVVRELIWRVTHALFAAAVSGVALSRLAFEPRLDPGGILRSTLKAFPIAIAFGLAQHWVSLADAWLKGPVAVPSDRATLLAVVTVAGFITTTALMAWFALAVPAAVANRGGPGRAVAASLAAVRGFRWPILGAYLFVRLAETQATVFMHLTLLSLFHPASGTPLAYLKASLAVLPSRVIDLAWIVFIAAAYYSQAELQGRAQPQGIAEVFD